MKSLLEDLWNRYEFERSGELLPEEKSLLQKLNKARQQLNLSSEEEKYFEEYFDILSQINFERNKISFFDGIKLGANFILETVINENQL